MAHDGRTALRDQLLSGIPRWYSPWGHLLFPAVSGIAVIALALSRVEGLTAWQLAFVPLFFALGNAIEWHAHRDVLHRRTRLLAVLHQRHTPQHHAVYVSDRMAIEDWRELKLILLPAYGVLTIVLVSSPLTLLFLAIGQPNLAALWVATVVGYVLLYEWLHLAYHLPEDGPIGRLRVIGYLRRHHQQHHAPQLMQRWNFNVTLPLWDHLRGTVYRPTSAPVAGAVRRAP